MQDIPAIAEAAKARGIWTIIDNTWATGHYFKPLSFGIDVAVNACTKYIVGHADAMLGAIVANERAAKKLEYGRVLMGVCPGSEEVYLGLRGLRTLDVRLERHHKSAWSSQAGSNGGPKLHASFIPPFPRIPATRSGRAITKAHRVSSPSF